MYERLNDVRYYRKFYFQDSFYAQCMDVEELTMIQFDRSVKNVRKLMDKPIFRTAKHILGTGCGDSNIAAFAIKEAFEHYLPDVEYEAVEAIELSRHYEYPEDGSESMALFISVSGQIFRTIEALEQCKKHGITTIAVTNSPDSPTARKADILYYENTPTGDNNAGLRTYYVNVMSCIILAAAMAEVRSGKPELEQLRIQVKKYHEAFFTEIPWIDQFCFETAIRWMDTKKHLEIMADGPLFWTAKFIQAKIIELSGDPCAVIDSENYKHVNQFMEPGSEYGEIVLINSNDTNVSLIVESVENMVKKGRDVLLFADKEPEELAIQSEVRYCYVPFPEKEWNFLQAIFSYLPGAIFAGFRHTTIGEPMFRGGFDPTIFTVSYFAPIDVVDI